MKKSWLLPRERYHNKELLRQNITMKFSKQNILFHIGRMYVKYIERIPYINWFNPLITLYLNFRSFPLQQAWRLPVFVYGWPKLFSLYGSMECVGKCRMGMVTFNATNQGAPSTPGTATAIDNWGRIIFHGKCQIYTANKINVGLKGVLELGEGSKIMHFCNVTAYELVKIGAQSRIVHRCQVIDTNFHYIADFNKHKINRWSRPIEIGDYCWICNSTSVTAGAKIPNHTIVASNSLVNKDYSDIPEESIIGGIPAKFIANGYRRVENEKLNGILYKYFSDHPDSRAFDFEDNTPHSFFDVE